MSKINAMIVAAVLPTIKAVGKIEMEAVLLNIKEHNTADVYKNTILGLHSNFSLLREVALRTKSKLDNGIIDLVLEAVEENAADEGITLA